MHVHVLRQYTNVIEGLTDFAARAASNPVTQGVVLDINPIWLAAYRLARAGLRTSAFDLHWSFWPYLLIDDVFRMESFAGDAIDFKWVDKTGWVENLTRNLLDDFHKKLQAAALPFIVKAIAKPVGSDLAEQRQALIALAVSQTFVAFVETRPLGSLAVAPGDACVANSVPGTIGGFLRNGNKGSVYAATCGHVASQGASVTVGGKHLGICSHSHKPTTLSAGQPCTPACPNANRLDLALIDIGSAAVSNTVTGVAAQIASRQSITFRGSGGVHSYEVGGVVITYCPGNSNICFENMFEVRPLSSGGIVSPRVRNFLATVPTQGDSGGWVETVSPVEWCGVLVAADSLMGYALEADDILNEANTTFGMQLQLA
jgi:hypothetical protein